MILKEVKGGYNKEQVLRRIDALNMLLLSLENGMDKETAMKQLEAAKSMPLTNEKGGFFSKKGFSVTDCDSFFDSLERQIINAMK